MSRTSKSGQHLDRSAWLGCCPREGYARYPTIPKFPDRPKIAAAWPDSKILVNSLLSTRNSLFRLREFPVRFSREFSRQEFAILGVFALGFGEEQRGFKEFPVVFPDSRVSRMSLAIAAGQRA
jgi:hypothetical protein